MNLVNQEAEKLIGANPTLEQMSQDVLKSTIRMKDEKIKTQELIIKELSFKLALLTSKVSSLRLELQSFVVFFLISNKIFPTLSKKQEAKITKRISVLVLLHKNW